MGELIHFSPKATLTADQNLTAFIHACRHELTVFGGDLNWDATNWPGVVNFTKIGVHSRGYTQKDLLDADFLDFAKAYFRYQQGHSPTKTRNEGKALRAIEAALLQVHGKADIRLLDINVLDEAASIGRKFYSKGAAYQCGREIARLASFVSDRHLIAASLGNWVSPVKKPEDLSIQVSLKGRAQRLRKLPAEEAVNALMEIFASDPRDPRDIFTTCFFAILMCAPSRGIEIINLPVDLEVEEVDSKGVSRYGWRFVSGKDYGGNIKWIPTAMVPIAREAIRRIKALTDEPRRLARWIEENPDRFYRHEGCPNVGEDQPLTNEEAAAALGLVKLRSSDFQSRHKVKTLKKMWPIIIGKQPKTFPVINEDSQTRFSEALFCMKRNLLNGQKGTSAVVLWMPTLNTFNDDVSPKDYESSHGHHSIFDRHEYRDADGNRIKLTSHQARHLLNTLAQRGGMSDELIAKWSGRKDIKQNRAYNHMSAQEMVARAEALDLPDVLSNLTGDAPQYIPVTTQEFNLVERGAVHKTEFGFCVHDYMMSPCDKFVDCLNCCEQVCIKGDGDCVVRLKARLSDVERDLNESETGMNEGFMGADRWYEHHQKTVVRLRQLVDIMESPQVPEGAQVKLRDGRDYSHLSRALGEQGMLLLEANVDGLLPGQKVR